MSPPTSLVTNQRIMQLKPPGFSPKTPTRQGPAKAHLVASPGEDYTDWVAYSAPVPELDDLDLDVGDNSFDSIVTESTGSRSSTPCTMIERMLDVDQSDCSATECDGQVSWLYHRQR